MAAKSKSINYKRTITTSLKAAGYIDIEDDGIYLDTDDGAKDFKKLLSDFQGAVVELSVTVKDISDLPDPSEPEE